MIGTSIDARENFIQFSDRKPLRRQLLLRAEHNLRPGADSVAVSLDNVLPISAQPDLPAVAELERGLIAERVRAGLRNARAKGKRLGRPRKSFDSGRVEALRSQGLGWRAVAKQLGVGVGTLYRLAGGRSKTQEKVFETR